MTDSRAAAMKLISGHMEAKLSSLSNRVDGGIRIGFVVHKDDVTAELRAAQLGSFFMLGYQQFDPDAKEAPAKPKQKWDELSACKQAGIRCKEPEFWKFLGVKGEGAAGDYVRQRCEISSRSELDINVAARFTWVGIDKRYQAYLTEQRHADNLSRG